eukprot:1523206-Pleurochrysis_carterae.AAC.2
MGRREAMRERRSRHLMRDLKMEREGEKEREGAGGGVGRARGQQAARATARWPRAPHKSAQAASRAGRAPRRRPSSSASSGPGVHEEARVGTCTPRGSAKGYILRMRSLRHMPSWVS